MSRPRTIRHIDRTVTQQGREFQLFETRDGVQRGLIINDGDRYIGGISTNKWTAEVYAVMVSDPKNPADRVLSHWKQSATEGYSKDRLFTEMRQRIIATYIAAQSNG